MATLRAQHQIYSSPAVYVQLYADTTSTDTKNNSSTIHCDLKIYVAGTNSTWWSTQGYSAGLSESGNPSTTAYTRFWGGTTTTVASSDLTRTHDSNGSFTWEIGYYFTTPAMGSLGYTTVSFAGTKIARGFSATPSIALSSRTETTATFTYSTSESMNTFEVYVGGSKTSNATGWQNNTKSGTFTVSGLSANTSYSIYVKCNRADTSVQGTSNTVSVTTYSYPYITGVNNFTIGGACSGTLYNPLSRSVTLSLTIYGDSTKTVSGTITTSGTSFSGWSGYASEMYACMPKKTSATFRVTSSYGITSTKDGTVYVGSSIVPTFSLSKTYEGASKVSSFMGSTDNVPYVSGLSSKYFYITASGSNSSTISKVSVTLGGVTKEATSASSGNLYVVGAFNTASNGSYLITVTDSRGRSTNSGWKSITYVNYSTPSVTVTASRTTQTGTNGTATVNGTYTNYTYGSKTNTLSLVSFTRNSTSTSLTWSPASGSVSASASYTDLNQTSTYKFYAKVQDSFGNTAESSYTLSISTPTLWLGKTEVKIGNNLTVAGTASISGNATVAGTLTANGNATVAGTLTVKGNATVAGTLTVNGKTLLDRTYPVGSIYMSVNSTSPATLFGGTWAQLTNRFLIGAGSGYSNGSTGGATSHGHNHGGSVGGHTLTVNEMPSHNHVTPFKTSESEVSNYGLQYGGGFANRVPVTGQNVYTTTSTGGGGSHNHSLTVNNTSVSDMPPYLAVYMWKRTA